MSDYTKPKVSFVALNATAVAANCSNGTSDWKEIKDILVSMGYDLDEAFGEWEDCAQPVMFEDYCKFTSSIQVFMS